MTNYYQCGVDEAGRGPLAGSVYAAAVILDHSKPISGIDDSKKLSASKRELLYDQIIAKALAYGIAFASVAEIDQLNILNATMLAMARAVKALTIRPNLALIDGNRAPKLDIAVKTIIKGDSLVKEISAASILAKVARDREMMQADELYPQYGFNKHKGYGTQDHLESLNVFGITPIHRKSFAPVAKIIANRAPVAIEPTQGDLF